MKSLYFEGYATMPIVIYFDLGPPVISHKHYLIWTESKRAWYMLGLYRNLDRIE